MRLDDQELLQLLDDLESDRVERKAALSSDREPIRQAICAFANDMPGHGLPGVLFVGVHDDGSCAGLQVTDELLRSLADKRDDGNIQPLPTMYVEKRVLRGYEMAVVTVLPALAPPVRVRGRTYIRVGPRRATATVEEERRLAERRRYSDLPFELRPCSAASLDDLDLDLFRREYLPAAVDREVLALNERSLEDQLKAVRFLDLQGCPTMLGLLIVGKEPRWYVPGASIQFLRIEGTELTDPIRDQKEVTGPLPQALRRLDEILWANNQIETSITEGPLEVRRPDYPPRALEQLTRNAVLHRTYEGTGAPVRCYWFSDRIEIHSPGGTYGVVTPDNFGQPGIADYRNLHLAEVMRVLGFVQRFGVGIDIARKELAENGNPPPEFKIQPTIVLATVRRRR